MDIFLQFYPIYKEVKNSKDTGSFEDFIECLKLYDKMENGTMMLGELEHILLSLGESESRQLNCKHNIPNIHKQA